ncbi:MAG TPA: SRPBCC family protein [Longimicrobium sp.]|nr:SRPBCC family protein [Longimicrobium sp.]
MNPTPSGRLVRTPEGRDLVLIRTFRAPIEDVWASITESERTARWFAAWTGEPGPGRTIQYSMGFEADGPPGEMQIVACEPPRHLAVKSVDDHGSWHLEGFLSETDGITELRFVHHLDASTKVSDVGPGWEYYLDNLVASRDGTTAPDFNHYDPSQRAYYLEREAELEGAS